MISKWSRPVTIVSFDFDLDKDKIFIGYQFVIISELVLDPAHLIRKRSWLAWVYTCTMYSIGVTNIKRVITRMRTIRSPPPLSLWSRRGWTCPSRTWPSSLVSTLTISAWNKRLSLVDTGHVTSIQDADKRVITRMRTLRRQDHEGRNKSTL